VLSRPVFANHRHHERISHPLLFGDLDAEQVKTLIT